MSQALWLMIVCAGLALVFGLWAQTKVRRTFARYSEVPTQGGLTGAQEADAVLRSSRLHGVCIRPAGGRLTDHHDPRSQTLNLSAEVGGVASAAALDVAAHDAIQHARAYWPMQVRRALVPAALIGQSPWFIPVVLGLSTQGLLARGEVDGARAVLGAAALTYVAGFVAALGQLVFFFLESRR